MHWSGLHDPELLFWKSGSQENLPEGTSGGAVSANLEMKETREVLPQGTSGVAVSVILGIQQNKWFSYRSGNF